MRSSVMAAQEIITAMKKQEIPNHAGPSGYIYLVRECLVEARPWDVEAST